MISRAMDREVAHESNPIRDGYCGCRLSAFRQAGTLLDARLVMRMGDANIEMTSRVPIAGFTMKTTLRPGLVHVLSYRLTGARTPASTMSRTMPRESGTSSMIGLIQWATMEAMRPYLGAGEHSVGLDIDILHAADAPAGVVAHVEIVVEKVEGRKVFFRVKAYDGDRSIGEGTHERFVIDRERLHPGVSQPRRRPVRIRPSRGARTHDTRRVG